MRSIVRICQNKSNIGTIKLVTITFVTMTTKLVRDKIPEIINAAGKRPIIESVTPQHVYLLLKEKLIEEAQELKETKTREALVEELADVLEVCISLAEYEQVDWQEVEAKRKTKGEERGRFAKGLVWKGNL